MEIDYDVVKTVRELEKQGYDDERIAKELKEMEYTPEQIAEIMGLAQGVDGAEKEDKTKKILIAMVTGFISLVFLMALFAIFLS